jgi:hydroxyacylglutathione hydrolase
LEIVPGIHKIDGVIGVNCYLLKTEQGWLIVDTGLPGQENKVLNYLKKQDIRPSAVTFIVLTHADLDHIGCARALRAATGAKIAIHPGDVPVLTGKQSFKTINNFFKHAVNLAFSLMHYPPVEPDILLEGGANLDGWQILHTPGHTPGSICLFLPGKCLLVGDALRTSWQANPRPISKRICVDLAQARQSLIKIAALDYEVLLPGHGAPIANKASMIIRHMVKRTTSKPLNTKKILRIY